MTPANLLVRGVNWLGDAVMSTPALQRLREALPRARITLLTQEKLAGLWHHHPALDQVLTFTAADSPWRIARHLRPHRFDTALLLPNSLRAALEVRLAGIPVRLGVSRPWRDWLLTGVIAPQERQMRKRTLQEIRAAMHLPRDTAGAPYPPHAHHVFHYLRLLEALDIRAEPATPRLTVDPVEIGSIRQRIHASLQTAPVWLGLNPGAEYGPAKRWPASRFAETAMAVHRKTKAGWILFGGPGDAGLCAEIHRTLAGPESVPCIDLSGRTTLRELAAAMTLCRVFLTNDTGPMHLAAAVGTPVVALFGSTSPELTRPGHPLDPSSPHILMQSAAGCSPCFQRQCPIDLRCLTRITVDQAVDGVLRALGTPGRQPSPP